MLIQYFLLLSYKTLMICAWVMRADFRFHETHWILTASHSGSMCADRPASLFKVGAENWKFHTANIVY